MHHVEDDPGTYPGTNQFLIPQDQPSASLLLVFDKLPDTDCEDDNQVPIEPRPSDLHVPLSASNDSHNWL